MKRSFSSYQSKLCTSEKNASKQLNKPTSKWEREKEAILAALNQAGIDPGRRGETLSIEEFGRLSDELYVYYH